MSFDETTNISLLHTRETDVPSETRVIVIEDNQLDRDNLLRTVQKSDLNLELDFVGTVADMSCKIAEKQFDLAIIDFQLPDGTGLEAMRLINQCPQNGTCGTVMIATQAQISVAISAMKAGCSDYIIKDDLTPATLRRAVINGLQKSALKARVTEAGRKLVNLRAALREHTELSETILRPIIKRSLAQISALEFASLKSGQSSADARLDLLAEYCKEMMSVCDKIERDGALVREALNLPR